MGGSRILGPSSYPLLTEYKPITRLTTSNRVIVVTRSRLVPVIGSDRLTAVNRSNEFPHKDRWIPLSNRLLPSKSNRLLPSNRLRRSDRWRQNRLPGSNRLGSCDRWLLTRLPASNGLELPNDRFATISSVGGIFCFVAMLYIFNEIKIYFSHFIRGRCAHK